MTPLRTRAVFFALLLALLIRAPLLGQPRPSQASTTQTVQTAPASAQTPIRDYIAAGWQTLSRSMSDCKSVVDLKVTTVPILYLPAGLATPAAVASMQHTCRVEVRHLPRPIHFLGEVRPSELPVEGLLYLPNRYVVPGGRFNEMYGWDSYFIMLGLVRDHQMDLARGMVENFFFEIENYGAILNANRTYFFTRSQPPFLTSMIRAVYEAPGTTPDPKWLAPSVTKAVFKASSPPKLLSMAAASSPCGFSNLGVIAAQKKAWFQACAALLNSLRSPPFEASRMTSSRLRAVDLAGAPGWQHGAGAVPRSRRGSGAGDGG